MTPDPTAETVLMVPLADHLALARLVFVMRKAQEAYFAQKRSQPHLPVNGSVWRAARDAEKRVDSAVAALLNREQRQLPGMEDEPPAPRGVTPPRPTLPGMEGGGET